MLNLDDFITSQYEKERESKLFMKVAVLMSTYNGEKFIREQIDSILKQTQVDAQLIVRDDGSSDGTVRILEEYSRNYPNYPCDTPLEG